MFKKRFLNAVGGGGNHEESLKTFGGVCVEMPRGKDAKRQSLLRFELLKKIDKFLSLNLRNILISPLEGEKKFLSELNELRNFREGDNLKNSCRNSNSALAKQLRFIQLKRKVAFTLAEVLITLVIIGIVASLTMPTLIQNYKKTAGNC